MGQINNIITGHINELMNWNEAISEERLAICRVCPLFLHSMFGIMCNPKLYLNKDTGLTSTIPQVGFKKGCGCRLDAKTRKLNETCPTGKW